MQKGDIVKSIAGHDKDRLYVVLDITDKFAFLSDGFYKKPDQPKKKNIRHLKYVAGTELKDKINLMQVKKAVKSVKISGNTNVNRD